MRDALASYLRKCVLPVLILFSGCMSHRLYFLDSELPRLEGMPKLVVAPGPWEARDVPSVYSDAASVPNDLVIPALSSLMALPGAADACDPNTGRPRPDATEYCVAFYRTPEDWRVSWPIRNMTGQLGSCNPPLGGVEDKDFGSGLPIFGFAHNHPCGTSMSSPDLRVFPVMKAGEGRWMMVEYAVAPNGKPALDSRGQLIPAWGWLATGRVGEPRFYKWNSVGEVFKWNEGQRDWEFQAICTPQKPGALSSILPPPKCSPELN
ncbi:hypothetical protein [Vitiosangium sp. GDMCC 1.1324]|uniref:hypothetical protein n=1 Tax=Vitiosangium sp. (strain GDMCC 1.1324) TaxID=2138576 RepID=UPI0011B7911F|nr:hypothetical protein [Vitiosangium sp. GDMCC 1.1324]